MKWLCAILLSTFAAGCASEEAVRVLVPVEADGSGLLASPTDLGYTVRVSKLRLAVRDLQFTIRGEMHAGALRRIGDWILPSAHAHPGHYAGGEVTGQLLGGFVLDFTTQPAQRLGQAEMIVGYYHGGNLTYRKAGPSDGLPAGDPLLGHTAYIEGVADKDGRQVRFQAQVDIDDGAQLVGAPFDLDLTASSQTRLRWQILSSDPSNGNSLFGGVDFAALDPDGDGQAVLAPGQEAHNILRRTLQVHDFYAVKG